MNVRRPMTMEQEDMTQSARILRGQFTTPPLNVADIDGGETVMMGVKGTSSGNVSRRER